LQYIRILSARHYSVIILYLRPLHILFIGHCEEPKATWSNFCRKAEIDASKLRPKGEGQGCPESISINRDCAKMQGLLRYARNDGHRVMQKSLSVRTCWSAHPYCNDGWKVMQACFLSCPENSKFLKAPKGRCPVYAMASFHRVRLV